MNQPRQRCYAFCEFDGASAHWERSGEAMRAAMQGFGADLQAVLNAHGGELIKSLPEGAFFCFQGDGALKAVDLLLQRLAARAWPPGLEGLRLRVGVHAGEAVVVGGDHFGPVINKAARLMQAASGGQVLFSPEAQALAALPEGRQALSLGLRRLKDMDQSAEILELAPAGATASAFPPPATLEAQLNNLPTQPTAFIGRRAELQLLTERLSQPSCRLLTLLGPGGFGKTRLALQAATELAPRFPDGCWWVNLQALADPQQIPAAIASAMRFELSASETPQASVLRQAGPLQALLVLDNAEHLLAGAGLFEALLRAAPRLKLLCTSRVLLNLPSETALPVEGLGLPRADGSDLEGSASGSLLLQAVRRSAPELALRPADKAAAARICRQLSGSPLGLELAGAWARTLTLPEIADEIAGDLAFLAGQDDHKGRQSLAAMLEWTWRRLAAEEQRVLAALSVFAGGFDADAAAAVADAPEAALSSLQRQSLLRDEGPGRRGVHELIRQFARAKLALDPAAEAAALDRHSAHYMERARQQQAALAGAFAAQAAALLDPDLDNLRAAWARACAQGDREALAAGLDGLFKYYELRGLLSEGQAAFTAATRSIDQDGGDGQKALLARLQSDLAAFYVHQGQTELAGPPLEQCLAAFRELGLVDDVFFVLNKLSDLAEQKGDFTRSRDLVLQSIAERSWKGEVTGAWPLALAGNAYIGLGEYEDAEDLLRNSLQGYQDLGDPKGSAWVSNLLGYCLGLRGRLDEAWTLYQGSIELARSTGNSISEAWTHLHVGEWHGWTGDFAASQAHFSRGLGILRDNGIERGVAWGVERQARVLESVGEAAAARYSYQQALEPARRSGNQAVIAFCSAGLARLDAAQGHLAEAGRHLRACVDAAQRCRSMRYRSLAWVAEGIVHSAQQQHEAAARKAFQAARRPELEHDQRKLLKSLLARLFTLLGPQRYLRLRQGGA